jgi:hypothetical protein
MGCLETSLRGCPSSEIDDHLLQAERFEMIDHVAAEHHQGPAEQRQTCNGHRNLRVGDLPNHHRHRPPRPEQQQQSQTRQQHIGAALDGFGNEPGPPLLERFSTIAARAVKMGLPQTRPPAALVRRAATG